jgi:hypothetical protein
MVRRRASKAVLGSQGATPASTQPGGRPQAPEPSPGPSLTPATPARSQWYGCVAPPTFYNIFRCTACCRAMTSAIASLCGRLGEISTHEGRHLATNLRVSIDGSSMETRGISGPGRPDFCPDSQCPPLILPCALVLDWGDTPANTNRPLGRASLANAISEYGGIMRVTNLARLSLEPARGITQNENSIKKSATQIENTYAVHGFMYIDDVVCLRSSLSQYDQLNLIRHRSRQMSVIIHECH